MIEIGVFDMTFPSIVEDVVLLFVRILLFVAFLHEARHKLEDVKKFAEGHNLSVPMTYFVAIAEFLAALGMLLGFLAQWAGIGIILLMMGTLYLQLFTYHSKYWANKYGWEYDLIMMAFSAVIIVYGPGNVAIQAFL